jgi:hypothetical protein
MSCSSNAVNQPVPECSAKTLSLDSLFSSPLPPGDGAGHEHHHSQLEAKHQKRKRQARRVTSESGEIRNTPRQYWQTNETGDAEQQGPDKPANSFGLALASFR